SDESGSEDSGDKSSSNQTDTQFEESHNSDSQGSHILKEKKESISTDSSSEDDNEISKSKLKVSPTIKKFSIQRVRTLGESKTSSGSFITEPSDSEGVISKVHRKSKKKRRSIYIEIVSLKLLDETTISNDPTIQFLFVDYHGFLGLPPDQLETPQSLSKPS
ncbi:unnamed protein product, partial [Meganyctiphanes norvegica]